MLLVASAALTIEGRSTCPSPREVASKLEGLLPLDLGISRTATLEQRQGEVQLTLRDAVGTVLASKVIPARPSCSELAEISAVALAAWEAEFAERVPIIFDAPKTAAAQTPAKKEAVASDRTVVPGVEIGLGVIASWGNGWSGGAVMPLSYMFENSRWGIEVSGYFMGTKSFAPVRDGQRIGAGIGPRVRLVDRQVRLDAHLSVLSTSFTMTRTADTVTRFDPGALVGLRVIFGKVWRPWLGVTGTVWPQWSNGPMPIVEFSFCWGLSLGTG